MLKPFRKTPEQVLNYVWIVKDFHEKRYDEDSNLINDEKLRQTIPEHYLKNVFEVAKTHPKTDVWIWIDPEQIGKAATLTMQRRRDRPANVKIKYLNTIETYRDEPIFKGEFKYCNYKPIDVQADYARILVLDHVMKTCHPKQVFYSDFDIADPPLDSAETAYKLREHGMIFGKYRPWNSELHTLENQFMGFTQCGKAFLHQELLPHAVEAKNMGNCGYGYLVCLVDDYTKRNTLSNDSVTVHTKELPGSYTRAYGEPDPASWEYKTAKFDETTSKPFHAIR